MITTQVISDQSLIQQYLKGQKDSLEMLITRHKTRIYTSIYYLVRNQVLAEDIFQDTFIKVIDTLRSGKYQEEGKFLPWVMRIAHNLCIDHFRKNKKMPLLKTKEDVDVFSFVKMEEEENTEDKMVKEETHAKVRKLVELLPDEQREVVVLRHYADLSFSEIAKMTNVSINTALGRMRYALINLRKLIEERQVAL